MVILLGSTSNSCETPLLSGTGADLDGSGCAVLAAALLAAAGSAAGGSAAVMTVAAVMHSVAMPARSARTRIADIKVVMFVPNLEVARYPQKANGALLKKHTRRGVKSA